MNWIIIYRWILDLGLQLLLHYECEFRAVHISPWEKINISTSSVYGDAHRFRWCLDITANAIDTMDVCRVPKL